MATATKFMKNSWLFCFRYNSSLTNSTQFRNDWNYSKFNGENIPANCFVVTVIALDSLTENTLATELSWKFFPSDHQDVAWKIFWILLLKQNVGQFDHHTNTFSRDIFSLWQQEMFLNNLKNIDEQHLLVDRETCWFSRSLKRYRWTESPKVDVCTNLLCIPFFVCQSVTVKSRQPTNTTRLSKLVPIFIRLGGT